MRGAARYACRWFRRSPLTRDEVGLLLHALADTARRVEELERNATWQMRSTNRELCAEIQRLDREVAELGGGPDMAALLRGIGMRHLSLVRPDGGEAS